MILNTSAQQNWHRSELAQKKCKVGSFVFNGNLLHLKYDWIFALPLRLTVNHYHKQVISAQSQ